MPCKYIFNITTMNVFLPEGFVVPLLNSRRKYNSIRQNTNGTPHKGVIFEHSIYNKNKNYHS